MKRMASRELVTYCTFTEGAPILPLEALNNGVICLTGNNHHYFEGDERLKELLIVHRPDDPETIYNAIENALNHKEEILERYNVWKSKYDDEQKKNFEQLLNCLSSL
jgi:hypothetical protein